MMRHSLFISVNDDGLPGSISVNDGLLGSISLNDGLIGLRTQLGKKMLVCGFPNKLSYYFPAESIENLN